MVSRKKFERVLIPCAYGQCDEMIWNRDRNGKSRKYKNHHQNRGSNSYLWKGDNVKYMLYINGLGSVYLNQLYVKCVM
jgi:hypothetical protein